MTKTPSERPVGAATSSPGNSLLAPRINTLSKALTRHAVQFAKAEFGLSQAEWQVVVLLGVFEPISIRELAHHAMVDAAQISRAVTSLADREWVARDRSALDNREAVLTLTAEGRRVNRKLRAAAMKRNDKLLDGYSQAEIQDLFAMLDVLISRARTDEAA